MIDPIELLSVACRQAGSQKAWADANGVSTAYVNDVLSGRRQPGAAILAPLGVYKVVIYSRERPSFYASFLDQIAAMLERDTAGNVYNADICRRIGSMIRSAVGTPTS